MLLSVNWLKDFIPSDIPVNDMADRLTMSGIEVEEIIHVGHQWDNIIVAEIMEICSHPNADKLSLAKLTSGRQIYSVVCGAPNIREGLKVPLALEGANLKNGLRIKSSKIRGALSEGMLCSETELDLGNDGSGIMVLSPDSKTGAPLAESLHLFDTILDLGITPNRSDCLSVIGLAREISAILNVPLVMPQIKVVETVDSIEKVVSVNIKAPDCCPRYAVRLVSDVVINPSPLWMRRRLATCGIRSINNIVDITNYVLLEWGQPLHAFDFSTIKDRKIIVRRSSQGESFTTLDGSERNLPDNTLMICDAGGPVAIGGIMGGLYSGVTSQTTRVLLESAYFNPYSIARSSRALKLSTESSQRFEKGVDLKGVTVALNKAVVLISELCGANIAKGIIDKFDKPTADKKPIKCSVAKINKTIGFNLTGDKIKKILERLQVQVKAEGADILQAVPPSFRYDLNEPIDLTEEVARINGYENIPTTYPRASLSAKPLDKSYSLAGFIRDIMITRGFYEAINFSFFSPELLKYLNLIETDNRRNTINILNPLSSSQSILRPTIIPSLLLNLKENLNNKTQTLKIFEISKVFWAAPDNAAPVESKRITGLISGLRYDESWNFDKNKIDFYDIKGPVETLLERLQINTYRFENYCDASYLNPHQKLSLFIKDDYLGEIGEMHPDVLENYEIENSVYIFDLDFDVISMHYTDDVDYKPFSRQPAIFRDIALLVEHDIPSEKVYKTIKSFKSSLITEVKIFDFYIGDKIPSAKKSLAYRIKFQSNDRSLTDFEINKLHDGIITHLAREIGAELRH